MHYGGRTVAQGMSIAAGPNFDTPRQKRTDCGNVVRTVLSKEVAVSDHWPSGEPLWRWRLSATRHEPFGLAGGGCASRRGEMAGDMAIGAGLFQQRHFNPASLHRERAARVKAAAGRRIEQARHFAGHDRMARQNPGRRAAPPPAAPAYRDAADRNRSALSAPSRRCGRDTSRRRGRRCARTTARSCAMNR